MGSAVVAGGAGFIGSHLCKRLLDDGYEVICIDNLLTSDKKNLEELLKNPRFRFIEKDITQELPTLIRQLANQLSTLNFIFHLASPASPNKNSQRSYINHPIETLLTNSLGTYHLLMLARSKSAQFLYASSSEVYGDPSVSPQSEDYFGNVNPNGVRSVYDEGKRFGEAMVMAHVRKYDIDARIVRIFNTYGPKMQSDDGRVVSNFISQAINGEQITVYGDGSQTRSFCYVEDMVDGLMKALFTRDTKSEVINLGNPDERTIAELATIVKSMTNSPSKIVHKELPEDDPKKRCPDIAKAKKLLNWSPTVSLEEGLSKTIAYFKSL